MRLIVDIQLRRLKQRLESQGYEIKFSNDLAQYLSKKGYDPIYGARPLKRLIQQEVENPLAEKLLKGELKFDTLIDMKLSGDNQIVF